MTAAAAAPAARWRRGGRGHRVAAAACLLVAGALGACSPSPVAPQVVPPPPSPPAATVALSAVAVSAARATLAAASLSPMIEAAAGRVTRAKLEADLRALVRRGRGRSTEAELAETSTFLAGALDQAGYRVERLPVASGGMTADTLVAERAGGDPSRVVLLCAHYDAVPGSPGADDDASGVAALLEVARAVRPARGPGPGEAVDPGATLRFALFPFEEQGLVGSTAYVRSLDATERARLEAVLVLEMLGFRARSADSQAFPLGTDVLADAPLSTTGDFIGALGLASHRAPLEVLLAARAYAPELPVATLSVPGPALLVMPDLLRSDHAPFWLAGLPAVLVTDTAEFRNPNYHRPTDTLASLDLEFATSVTRWLVAGTLLLAQPAARPR